MSLDFLQYAEKGNAFVNKIAEELNVPRDQAGRIVRAVFRALRDRLSTDESFQLLAQLPMALKSVYVDGWKHQEEFVRIRHLDDFLDQIRLEDKGTAGYDFGNNQRALKAVSVVFQTLHESISEGGFEGLVHTLPESYQTWMKPFFHKAGVTGSSL
jgi:uncharacterized protein (DUF2267 family)